MAVPLSSHDNSSIPINDQNESKELKVTIDGAVGDLVNGLNDEEFLSWKAGRREWLIVLDLVAVALVVVCGQDTRTARFANTQPGPRCNHSRPSTSSRLYSLAYSNYEADQTRALLYHSMPLQRRLSGSELPTSLSRPSSNPLSLTCQTYLAADQCCFQTLVSLPSGPSSAASPTTSRYLLRDALFKASAAEDPSPWSLLSSRISFLSVSVLSTKP